MRSECLVVLVAVSIFPACARHVPGPGVTMPGTPHVSWIIMSGDRDNPDREFVCQSEPRTDCIVPVSRPESHVFSDVHIYYHGAGAETRYTGTVKIGFFKRAPAIHTVTSDIVVRKTGSIINHSVSDSVTSSPGTYSIDFDLVAAVADTKKTYPIQEKIRVVVK